VLKGVDRVDYLAEDSVENVRDARAALHFYNAFLDEAAFKLVTIRIDELVYKNENDLAAVNVH
jgi:hypothetical protein